MSGLLQDSPARVLSYLLQQLGAVAALPATPDSSAWGIFTGNEPSNPDCCLTLYGTQGVNDGFLMLNGEMVEHHGIQLRLRAVGEELGQQAINQLANFLDTEVNHNNVSVAGATYHVYAVTRTGQPTPLGSAEPGTARRLYTLNATIDLRQTGART